MHTLVKKLREWFCKIVFGIDLKQFHSEFPSQEKLIKITLSLTDEIIHIKKSIELIQEQAVPSEWMQLVNDAIISLDKRVTSLYNVVKEHQEFVEQVHAIESIIEEEELDEENNPFRPVGYKPPPDEKPN